MALLAWIIPVEASAESTTTAPPGATPASASTTYPAFTLAAGLGVQSVADERQTAAPLLEVEAGWSLTPRWTLVLSSRLVTYAYEERMLAPERNHDARVVEIYTGLRLGRWFGSRVFVGAGGGVAAWRLREDYTQEPGPDDRVYWVQRVFLSANVAVRLTSIGKYRLEAHADAGGLPHFDELDQKWVAASLAVRR